MSNLKNLRTREAALPPTQLNPSAGSGIPPYHISLMSSKPFDFNIEYNSSKKVVCLSASFLSISGV